jgi:hypothetical protein
MKQCPRCKQTYSDPSLNFCLEDGELLSTFSQEPPPSRYADDTPPTILLDQSRVTNPTNWPNQPSAQPPAKWQPAGVPQQQFGSYPMPPSSSLAVVSLILGISSLTIGWCCSLALILAPAALITGVMAKNRADKQPDLYTGRGMAIGGIVMGAISLAAYILFIIIYGIAVIGGGLMNN